ncbi:hypothetical protein FKM82_022381 [Ascaphus truei]
MVNRTRSHSRTAVMAQLHLAIRQDKDSTTLLWHEDGILNGIKYKNGSLTVATEGLYYVYCHLQFTIKQCMKEEAELVTKLSVNGLEKHQVMHTMCRQENCTSKIYRDQHLNLQLELKTSDNVSIQSTHLDFLNKEQLAQSNLFGIFML